MTLIALKLVAAIVAFVAISFMTTSACFAVYAKKVHIHEMRANGINDAEAFIDKFSNQSIFISASIAVAALAVLVFI